MKYVYFFVPLLLLTSLNFGQATGQTADNQGDLYRSVEERRLLVAMQEERSTIAREREELKEKKKELKRLESEVDKKLDQLSQLRLQIEQLLAEKSAEELKRLQDLSKMYEKMSPDKAARIFSTIDQGLAIAILEKMKTKAAARILNNMDRERAAALTTAFSTLDIQ